MDIESIVPLAAEAYLPLNPLERVGELKEIEDRLAECREAMADLEAVTRQLHEHRAALLFTIHATAKGRLRDDLPGAG